MTDFKLIPLKSIQPDPNQPRKIYDETAMQELVQSVKEKGILQPILIRPNGHPGTFLLVCGERRFRASKEAGLEEIPAVVRELTDDEALELQIIENLQRKDVHPMEEAVAFKSLLDNKKYTVTEIANRVGKKDFYVKQRLKLNDLSKGWQKLFYHNGLSLTDALKIAMLEVKLQEELFKEEIDESDLKNSGYKYELNDWTIRKYKGDLHKAPFSLEDPKLNPKMGPCTTCKFNTAVACLFPEDASSPRCTFVPCFKTKVDNNFQRALKEAQDDPAIVFVSCEYRVDEKDKVIAALKKEGHAVLKRYDDFSGIDAPEKPDWEEFKEDYYDEDESEAENRKEFERNVAEYNKELEAYNKKVASGKYKKAFVVDGEERGRYIYIELKQKGTAKAAKAAVESNEPTVEDIDTEIANIKAKEKRAKEIDGEKVWQKIKGLLGEPGNRKAIFNTSPLSQLEKQALAEAIQNKVGFSNQDWIDENFEGKKRSVDFKGVTDLGINILCRILIADALATSYGSHVEEESDNWFAYSMIKQFLPEKITTIELEQQEAATRRNERVTKRIAALQAQKKELAKPKAKADTKPAAKKSTTKPTKKAK